MDDGDTPQLVKFVVGVGADFKLVELRSVTVEKTIFFKSNMIILYTPSISSDLD